MFALLVYAPFENLTSLKEDHIDCWGPHPWTRYLVARAAMRNGHFKKVALPLLQSIRHHVSYSCKTFFSVWTSRVA